MLLDESSLMFELLKPESVRKLLNAHRSGRQDNHKLLFQSGHARAMVARNALGDS